MTSPRLSAVLIVKDEETKLQGCLQSLSALGDALAGIYVYDTGSKDGTIEIARTYGADVVEGYWDNDFARARNAALARAETDWILSLDADERLTVDVPRLVRILADDGADAVTLAIIDRREGEEIQAHLVPRLFRRSRAAWRGRVHEQVETFDGAPLRRADPGRQVLSLLHTGYDEGPRMQSKRERNASLAIGAIAEAEAAGETDSVRLVRALVDHARTIMDMGEQEFAVQQLRRVRATSADPLYRNFGLEILAECLSDTGRLGEAEGVIKELRRAGITPAGYVEWLALRVMMRRGQFAEALIRLRRLDVLANCMGVVGKPHMLLNARMTCALATRNYLEAAACLIQLTVHHGKFEPGHVELLLKLAIDVPKNELADMLITADGGFLKQMLAELKETGPLGAPLAAAVLRRTQTGRSFGAAISSSTLPVAR